MVIINIGRAKKDKPSAEPIVWDKKSSIKVIRFIIRDTVEEEIVK